MAPLSPAWAPLALLPLLLLLLGAEASVGPSTNTSFCTESKECLEYQLVCKTDEYEVRHYGHTRWVSTDAEAYFMGVGAAMAFRRLFQYITGANEGGVQMEMTAPVLVRIPEETKMWEPAVYTLNFPLPAAYQDEPPAPTSDKLYFTVMPEMDVYVKSYGGWMLSVTSRLYAHMLTKELDRVRAPYNHSYHYGVGYDSPLKLLNRHNEVWYVAEGPVVCTDPQEPTPAHTTRPSPTGWSAGPGPLPQVLADSPSALPSELSANMPLDSWSHAPSAGPPASGSPDSASPSPGSASGSPGSASGSPGSASPSPVSASTSPGSTSGLPGSASTSPGSTSGSAVSASGSAVSASGSAVSTSVPSNTHTDDPLAFTPTSTPTAADPPSNSSDPAAGPLTPGPESGAPQWNSTVQSSVGADANSDPVVEPDGSH